MIERQQRMGKRAVGGRWVSTALVGSVALALALPVGATAQSSGDTDPDPVVTAQGGGGNREVDLCGFKGCRKHGEVIKVMTRNIFLGADLGPALEAPNVSEFIRINGEILKQVDATNMRVRSRGLAKEIRGAKVDVVGLQEVALWRTGPVNLDAALNQEPVATNVYQDFLKMLMKRLNKNKKRYRVVHVKDQFDFEGPADTDGDMSTGILGAEINGRFTMRDAVIVRRGQHIRVKNIRSKHYKSHYSAGLAGVLTVHVDRGWQSMKMKVRKSPWFRFSNTHLEAFDDRTEVPSIRAKQAKEFVKKVKRGPQPNIAVGDYNSDYPGLVPGDEQAFQVLTSNGFHAIGTTTPWSCCIQDSYDLTDRTKRDFDHRVDQVFTTTIDRVRLINSRVTGRKKQHGYWNSDHAGVVAKVLVLRKSAKSASGGLG